MWKMITEKWTEQQRTDGSTCEGLYFCRHIKTTLTGQTQRQAHGQTQGRT